ncbi:hypothetical protein [Aeoliella sp.]|uniref:hypothetical protein n=1 Tax=Aeoliella sp. TaxID=2795800 RepID=UPI003CCC4235
MKPLVDLATWLLEKNIRAKNAVSLLCALLVVAIVYFTSADAAWIAELDKRGPLGLPVALSVIFLTAFLSCWLIASAVQQVATKRNARRKQLDTAQQRELRLLDTLLSLTNWQRSFVLRYIEEGTTQIHEYEIGGHKVVWGPEVEMLVRKGIIRQHRRAGVYEIVPAYLNYLRTHWDPQTGKLS